MPNVFCHIILVSSFWCVVTLVPFRQAISAEHSETSVTENSADWLTVIRQIPYQYSNNFHSNLKTIREWVLLQKGFCEKRERHIFFNRRGEFLSYVDNQENKQQTQIKLNEVRKQFVVKKIVPSWIAGSENSTGYPFALNCDQPHTDIAGSIQRLLGEKEQDKLWGTWDGISAGSQKTPIPLAELVELVYKAKSKNINQPVVAVEFQYFLAQIIIESGAQKNGLSKQNAIGLLQLKPEVLEDCEIPKRFFKHRMAQVDCAVRLFQQNRRNLKKAFDQAFVELPLEKQRLIFSMLLVQSYHSGIGRVNKLLTDHTLNQATLFFAKNHHDYSAQDIATGIIYHNMGRQNLGLASLYYVVDVAIVARKLCEQPKLAGSWVCQSS